MSIKAYDHLTNGYKEKLEKVFNEENCLVEYNPGNFIMTPKLKDISQPILDFKVRKDDIWMLSFPRTGNEGFS